MGFQQRQTSPQPTSPAAAPPAELGVDQTQDVQGTRGLRSQAKRWQAALLVAGLLYAQPSSSGADVLPTQPDTWTQDVQGVSSLGQKARAWTRTAAGMGRLWQTADGQAEAETWTQPVSGVASLRQTQKTAQRRAGVLSALLWTSPFDGDGPLGTQEAPWPQPVVGTAALGARQRVRQAQVVNFGLLWQTTDIDVQPAQPDTWVQPVVGISALRAAGSRYGARSAQASLLYWAPAQDAPAVIVDEIWTQPVPGVTALRQGQQAFRLRAIQSALFWQTANDDSGPLGVQPDTWIQAVQGTGALAAGQRAFALRAAILRGLASGTVEAVQIPPPTGAPRVILIEDRLAIRTSGIFYVWLE